MDALTILTVIATFISLVSVSFIIIIVWRLQKNREMKIKLPGGIELQLGKLITNNVQRPDKKIPIPVQTPSPSPSPKNFSDKKTFQSIIEYFKTSIKKNENSTKQGQIRFPASLYPLILTESIKSDYITKAIAFSSRDEDFWPGYWGNMICGVAHPQNERIFIVENENQLYELKSTLFQHSSRYNVYVTHTGHLKEIKGDFSIINNEVVAYYSEAIDPKIDKEIVFDVQEDFLNKKRLEFENTRKLAVKFPQNIRDDHQFKEFVMKVFKKREISLYIDVNEYHQYERDHPYYPEMQQKIIKKIEEEIPHFKSPCKILEVGPGTGLLTEKYAGLHGVSIDLIELDSECCELHLSKMQRRFPNINEIYNEDFCKYEFKNHYDLILSSFANHHISYSKISDFYNKIARLLNSKGKFIFGEEYISDHENSDEGRIAALFTYHIHIISEALKKGKIQLAQLEHISLIQGIKKEGEYKVSLSRAKEDIKEANLKLCSHKIGPDQTDEEWGVYFCFANR